MTISLSFLADGKILESANRFFSVSSFENSRTGFRESICSIEFSNSSIPVRDDCKVLPELTCSCLQRNLHKNPIRFTYDSETNLCLASSVKQADSVQYYVFPYRRACSLERQILNFQIKHTSPVGILFTTHCSANIFRLFNISRRFIHSLPFSVTVITDDFLLTNYDSLKRVSDAYLDSDSNKHNLATFVVIAAMATMAVATGATLQRINSTDPNVCQNNNCNNSQVEKSETPTDKSLKRKSKCTVLKRIMWAARKATFYTGFLLMLTLTCSFLITDFLLYFCSLFFVLISAMNFLFLSGFTIQTVWPVATRPAFTFLVLGVEIKVKLYRVATLAIGIFLACLWFQIRHQQCSWILQNILEAISVINTVRATRMGSGKWCTLALAFVFLISLLMAFVFPNQSNILNQLNP